MKVLIFGATGTAGGSVLNACLAAPVVDDVRVVSRRALTRSHPKLRVVTHMNFLDYTPIAASFAGLDACLFCLGISATQVSGEAAYREITHDFAVAAAAMTQRQSPGAAFHYISGQGAGLDSRFMWARVKAETERDLMAQVTAVCWRPAFIDGDASNSGQRTSRWRKLLGRLFAPFPSLYVAGEDIGRAMLQATTEKLRNRIIPNAEIRALARRAGPAIAPRS